MTSEALPASAPTPALPPPGAGPDSAAAPENPSASKFSRFRRQVRAWWDGYYLSPDPAPARSEADDAKPDGDTWTPKRIKVAEMIWGDGFTFPGGVDYALELVKPMKLNAEKSFLDIGCGLGGASRAIAKTFGIWVTGMEASATVAAAGMRYSEEHGMAAKAPITAFDPKQVQLPAGKYDAVCVRKVFSRLGDKKPLFAEINKTLKPQGHVIILDYTLRDPDAASPALKAWRAAEDVRPLPGTLEDFTRELETIKFDVRVAVDATESFRAAVGQGWADFAKLLQGNTVDPEEARQLAREIALWGKRLAAIDSGDLRVVRIHGIKKGAVV
jgi:cyclopropane fatty-acyl-phospholipid synthase-like methyltransferase